MSIENMKEEEKIAIVAKTCKFFFNEDSNP